MLSGSFVAGRAATAAWLMLGAAPSCLAADRETVLATLSQSTGGMPVAGLVADGGGNPVGNLLLEKSGVYGTACDGGAGYGVIFGLTK